MASRLLDRAELPRYKPTSRDFFSNRYDDGRCMTSARRAESDHGAVETGFLGGRHTRRRDRAGGIGQMSSFSTHATATRDLLPDVCVDSGRRLVLMVNDLRSGRAASTSHSPTARSWCLSKCRMEHCRMLQAGVARGVQLELQRRARKAYDGSTDRLALCRNGHGWVEARDRGCDR